MVLSKWMEWGTVQTTPPPSPRQPLSPLLFLFGPDLHKGIGHAKSVARLSGWGGGECSS